MKKQDLKEGLAVVTREGYLGFFFKDSIILKCDKFGKTVEYIEVVDYNEDLETENKIDSIDEVYEINSKGFISGLINNGVSTSTEYGMTLIWRRDIEDIKPKTPKYVRVVEEPKEEYYSDKVGKVYKFKEYLDDNKLFIEIKGHGLALISKEDCEPVTKEELIQVGSYVKIKKYKKEKYNNLDEDEISLWKEHQGRIFKVKEKGNDWIEFEGNSWVWHINIVKPVLDMEVD